MVTGFTHGFFKEHYKFVGLEVHALCYLGHAQSLAGLMRSLSLETRTIKTRVVTAKSRAVAEVAPRVRRD